MDRWQNRVAVVTGASSGIGARIALDLVRAGMTVVGLARRAELIEENRKVLPISIQPRLHAKKCDVTDEKEVRTVFDWVDKTLGGTDVLINNAGTACPGNLATIDTQVVRQVIDLNVMAIVYCTQRAFHSMKSRNVDGHVILINSVIGHQIPVGQQFNIYGPTKYAVTAMTEVYRQEFSALGSRVKITSVSPGLVDTEIVPEEIRKNAGSHMLKTEDISNAVLYTLSTPPHVQVHELELRPL